MDRPFPRREFVKHSIAVGAGPGVANFMNLGHAMTVKVPGGQRRNILSTGSSDE